MQRSIVAHCRAGFERECASDILRTAERARIDVTANADAGSALLVASGDAIDDSRWQAALKAAPPWFARSIFVGSGPHEMTGRDRIAPLLALARDQRPPFRAIWLETADSDAGKTCAGLCRRLGPLVNAAAATAGLLASDAASGRRLHVVFISASRVWMGISHDATGSPWPMGIPRLAMPHSAPSRSTLKLTEALLTFLSDDERARFLRPGMRAVDLGAAPGGWTWQLVQRDLSVKAIDNGPLKGAIADDPRVEHLRENGLKWRPRRPVDWMVCDMVEAPSRIAALVAGWMADGACRRTIFNLKLPMKKRYAEVERCAALIADALSRRKLRHVLRFKQLYHDREEITGYCSTMY